MEILFNRHDTELFELCLKVGSGGLKSRNNYVLDV